MGKTQICQALELLKAYRFNYIYTLSTENLIKKLKQLKLGHTDWLYFTSFIAIERVYFLVDKICVK